MEQGFNDWQFGEIREDLEFLKNGILRKLQETGAMDSSNPNEKSRRYLELGFKRNRRRGMLGFEMHFSNVPFLKTHKFIPFLKLSL